MGRASRTKRGRAPQPTTGRLLRASTPDRRRIRLSPIAGLGAAIAVAIVVLGAVVATSIADRDLHVVATADGIPSINRADLRARMALEAFLALRHGDALGAAQREGRLTESDVEGLKDQDITAQTSSGALALLLDDRLLAPEAAARHFTAPVGDPAAELARYLTNEGRLHLQWIAIDGRGSVSSAATHPFPAPKGTSADPVGLTALGGLIHDAITSGQPVMATVGGLVDSGWRASGGDTWAPLEGDWQSLDPSLLAAARAEDLAPNTILGPFQHGGAVVVGRFLERSGATIGGPSLVDDANRAGIDGAVLRAWATDRALIRAIGDQLVADAATTPVDQVRGNELLIGPLPQGDPSVTHVALDQLTVSRLTEATIETLAGSAPSTAPSPAVAPADRLAGALRALAPTDRIARFRALEAVANAGPVPGLLDRSGPIGWFAKDDVLPTVAAAIADPTSVRDTILGPFETGGGPTLFLVRGRFTGPLDDRASAALTEVMAADQPDLAAFTLRFDPSDIDWAGGVEWRSALGFTSMSDPAVKELFALPAGSLSQPLVIDSRLALIAPIEHRIATPSTGELDAYRLSAVGQLLVDARASRKVWTDLDPLGDGLPGASASPSSVEASETPLPYPTVPPNATPDLPDLPSFGAAGEAPAASEVP
jgi:hypothetical protein